MTRQATPSIANSQPLMVDESSQQQSNHRSDSDLEVDDQQRLLELYQQQLRRMGADYG